MKMPIPDDWDGLSTCEQAICWPDSDKWRAILWGIIEMPYQGRFWDFSTGSFLQTKSKFEPIYKRNQERNRFIMSCNEENFERLLQVLSALGSGGGGSSGCCVGIGGTRRAGQDGIEGGTPPPNFQDTPFAPSSPEFDNRKCIVANMVVDYQIEVLTKWNQFGVDDILTAIATGGFSAATSYVVGLLAGVTLGWTVLVVGVAALVVEALISNALNIGNLLTLLGNNRSQLVCDLYESGSAAQARDRFISTLNTNGLQFGQDYYIKSIFLISDVLNNLFFEPEDATERERLQAEIDAYPVVNCGSCANPDLVYLQYFGLLSGSLSSSFTVQSACVPAFGDSRQGGRILGVGGAAVEIEFTGSSNLPSSVFIDWADENGVYNFLNWSSTLPTTPILAKSLNVYGSGSNCTDTPYTLDVTVSVP